MKILVKSARHTAVVAFFVLVAAAPPALASEPEYIEYPVGPVVRLDPCTGTPLEIMLFVERYAHFHKNNRLARYMYTGYTNTGYELFSGFELRQINEHVVRFHYKLMWRHEDGRMWESTARFVDNIEKQELVVNLSNDRCIGGETVLP